MNLQEPATPKDIVDTIVSNYRLTETEAILLHALSDGKQHQASSLQRLLDKMVDYTSLKVYICRLRRKLRERGEDIATERMWDRTWFRWVRTVFVK